MRPPHWITCSRADLPAGDGWLGERERVTLARLTAAKRRGDWLLGRWTAKAALAAWLGEGARDVEVVAAPDGAPEAWIGSLRAPVALSLSHRADRALAVVWEDGTRVGCDLEVVEPRSDAFVREWLAPGEQQRVDEARDDGLAANLAWAAKEAAAKVLREGLRLDLRNAVTECGHGPDAWSPFHVEWPDRSTTHGWWRSDPGWVLTVAGDPAPDTPVSARRD